MLGSEILFQCLKAEGTKKIFGYPGGAIMPVFDALYDHDDDFDTVLVRHEQGAIHAAQGYARVSGEVGVVIVTSGPGATNVITGIADANIDSTPLVVITGQVATGALGTDAFQETDFIGMTLPVTKWNYQINRPEDIQWAVARAFYLARSGRPGPVVLDFPKNAQIHEADFSGYKPCNFIRSYQPVPAINPDRVWEAVNLINTAQRPFIIGGQGIILGHAEKEFRDFVEKTGAPFGVTLLGLSAVPSDMPHFLGMIGMHGSIVANKLQQQADLIVVIGCRLADRVTGPVNQYAPLAKIVHIDIDPSELGKNVKADVAVCGDCKEVLSKMLPHLYKNNFESWIHGFDFYQNVEQEKVINPEVHPTEGPLHMGEVIDKVAEVSKGEAIVVTDVGQNQMFAARYARFNGTTRSFLSSGGLGTMGFCLPAAIGAKIAAPERQVVAFVGDGGIQMTIEELGTIMQEGTAVKIVIFDNTWLGNVRQWQELFFAKRYSYTKMVSPDYLKLAEAYGIQARRITERSEVDAAVREMYAAQGPFILHVCVEEDSMVYPMVPPGQPIDHILLNRSEKI